MGLDAVVFCDCFEKGRLKRRPLHPELLYLLQNGDVACRSEEAEVLEQFDRWRSSACKHEEGMLAGCFIGNASHVGALNFALRKARHQYPILTKNVLFSGTHTGDYLSLKSVQALRAELESLTSFRTGDRQTDKDLQLLRRQLLKLVRVSLKVGKPIAF